MSNTFATLRIDGMNFGHPAEFRRWLSVTVPDLPKDFWGRSERAGEGPVRIQLSGHSKGGFIHGIGSSGLNRLLAESPKIMAAAGSQNPPVSVTYRAGEFNLKKSSHPIRYLCRKLTLEGGSNRRRNLWERFGTEPSPELDRFAAEFLIQRVARICEELQLEVEPTLSDFGDFSATPAAPVPVGGKTAKLYAVDLRFQSGLSFEGPWMIGPCASKGAGRIIKSIPGRGRQVLDD